MNTIYVTKRNGEKEKLNPDKYHQHLEHAYKGYEHLSISEVELSAAPHIVNGTKTDDIQEAFIRSSSEKIYEDPDHQVPAGRMLNQKLRKEVYGSYDPKPFIEMLNNNIESGVYDGDYLLEHYTREDLIELSSCIIYDKDDSFTYSGLRKNVDSYLIKQFDKIKETPQEMYFMMQLFIFAKYKDKYDFETRSKWVKEGYDILSNHEVSFPTPTIKQLRSRFRKFISCVLIPFGDSKHTIANAFRATLLMVSGGAGLGIMPGDIRGLEADIDNGRMKHTGTFPILKAEEKTTKAFTQPDRDGSTTAFYPFFHKEIELFMVLGNARGTDDTRVRDMDHAIMFNEFFFERYFKDEDITLFNMNDVLDINSYLGDYDKFKEMYEHAEQTVPAERQTKISARALFHTFVNERFLQSREYIAFLDNIITQGPWKVPVKESNLCVSGETYILTKEYGNIKIGKLVESGINIATCWNGTEWSKTTLAKTSESAKVVKVVLSNGESIIATPEHKWYVEQGSNTVELRTHELVITDTIAAYILPDEITPKLFNLHISDSVVSGIKIEQLIELEDAIPTYCGNEPKEHKLVFNGVLTGNCMEILTCNYPMYDTVQIRRNIVFKSEKHRKLYYDLRRELYHIQVDDSKHEGYLTRLRECYDFKTEDMTAHVDENEDYDYFSLNGYLNLGEIGVCIIAGINLGLTTKERLAIVSEYLVRAENELIDYMEYDLPEIEKAAKMRRTIGIGFSDIFHLLAKNHVYYNTREGRQLVHDWVELASFHMIRTSIELAKDFGPCKLITDTKWDDGIMPYDTYNKNVDELVTHNNQGLDWEGLRVDLLKYGMYNSTLMANAPFSGSAGPSGSTNGIEPPRGLIAKKSGVPKIVPEYNELKDWYTTAWSPEFNNFDYFKLVAVVQKWMDQGISLNDYQDLTRYVNNKIKKSELVKLLVMARYYGQKTLYYQNMKSIDKNDNEESELDDDLSISLGVVDEGGENGCSGGGCQI